MRLENPRHEAFCFEYMKNGFNAKQAYKTAYKTKNDKTAETNGDRLRSKAEVKARLKELREESTLKYGIDMQKLVDELNEIIALGKSGTVVDTEKGVRLLGQDLPASLKGIDMLIRIIGGYATEKSKTDLQFLDKNGQPTEPPTTTINKSYFKKDVSTEN